MDQYSLNAEKAYREQIQLSSSPLKKLLGLHEKPVQSQNSTVQQSEIDLNFGNKSSKSLCFPRFLSWLGRVCTPCKIFCPFCFCACCYCSNQPLFQQQVKSLGLLQQWGRYKRTLQPGLHVINPVSQSILQINQQTHILQYSQICISRDNVQFEVTVVLFYRVVDSLKVAYRMGSTHVEEGVKEIAVGLLRSVVGENNLQSVIESRNLVSIKFTQQMNQMMNHWGVHIEVTSIKEIKLQPEMQRALQAVAETQRSSQAMLINYRGQVSCAALYKEISEIIDTKAAYQIRFLNMVEQILSNGSENVVFMSTQLHDKVDRIDQEGDREEHQPLAK